MKKMSVAEVAEFFGVSKEAIHNRIRRGSLQSVMENNVKMVFVDETKSIKKPAAKRAVKSVCSDERYYKLLEAQNAKLQERVEILENETRTLRDQKEQMLIEECKKIERIYKEKDEQLKNILQAISSKFMLDTPLEEKEKIFEAEMVEIEEEIENSMTSLKKYLKKSGLSDKKMKKIKKRFDENVDNDERVIKIGSKYYLNTAKYDYSDLVK